MKQKHFRSEKLQERYELDGGVCPADLCDIFECPEFSEKVLRLQVYKDRSDGNYEGRPDFRDGSAATKRNAKAGKLAQGPFRHEMIQHYDDARKAYLMQRCHRTFLDCVDYENTESLGNILSGFDFFSQIYCQKFDEGQTIDEKEEKIEKVNELCI